MSVDRQQMLETAERLNQQMADGIPYTWETLEQALSFVTEKRDRGIHGRICYFAAFYHLDAGNQEQCLKYLDESVRCLLGTDQEIHVARVYNMIGIVAHMQNNLSLAMEQYGRALDYTAKYNDKMVHSIVLSNMADAYYLIGVYDRAVQFGPKVTPEMFKTALKELGFADVYETALGADMGCMAEAEHYVKEVATGKQQFALTSCCPSWSVMAKNLFPETIDKISNELTPMVATARLIKQEHPDASVVFIGPCASKKLEASRRTVRSDVDFVITFEELTGMFEAKGILLDEIKAMDEMKDATAAGRGYGVAGGVANAIKECIEKYYPGTPVNIQHAESLAECKKALLLAKAGKMNGCLIEGMACPGGCIAGAGTNIAIPVAARAVDKFKNEAEKKVPDESVDQEMVELEKE